MKLKTFHGETMSEALQRVKREFGRDAVILSTRTLTKGGLLGMSARNTVEITAAPDTSLIPPSLRQNVMPLQRSASSPAGASSYQGKGSSAPNIEHTERLLSEMGSLKDLIHGLVQQTRDGNAAALPASLYQTYRQLIATAIADELALEVVEQVRGKMQGREFRPDDVSQELRAILAQKLPVAGPIKLRHNDRPTIVALVGPTGSGKTTTIAKLAANAALQDQQTVGLITIDTYRIAAVDQLRTYAQIMNIPLQVVCTPDELPGAIARLADRQLILIDTAGRSQKDCVKIDELKVFFEQCQPDEIHIVVPATANPKTLSEVVDRFKTVGGNRILFTKLDEAVGLGVMLTCLAKANTNLSYITTGQDVPSDISVGDSGAMVQMILDDAKNASIEVPMSVTPNNRFSQPRKPPPRVKKT